MQYNFTKVNRFLRGLWKAVLEKGRAGSFTAGDYLMLEKCVSVAKCFIGGIHKEYMYMVYPVVR